MSLTVEQMKKLEPFLRAAVQLQKLKVGDTVDEKSFEAIQFFIKDVPKPTLLGTIHFDSNGQGYTLNDDVFDMKASNLKKIETE